MGNTCVKPSSMADVEAEAAAAGQVHGVPPSASAAKLAAAGASKSSSEAADSIPAAAASPKPPAGSKDEPHPRNKKCCFAEGPAIEWQIPAQAAAGPAQP